MDRKVKLLFEESQQQILMDEERKKKGIANVVNSADLKPKKNNVGRLNTIWNQSRYMDKTMLWIQFLTEGILALFFFGLGNMELPRQDMIAYAIVCSGMMGVLLPATVHRSFASNMVELSETCYFNTKQIVVLQMVYSGIISFMFVMLGILFIGIKWQMRLVQISLYVLVPFIFSGCCCLGSLLTKKGRRNPHTFGGMVLFLGMFYLIFVSIPCVYEPAVLGLWVLFLGIGICLAGIQLAILFRYIDKGEILCMN